ncbi:MAG: hypothetical protein HKN88_02210 [Gammaproteobacteria bacterium]|nr:hypothetical protein [Gammaproteobacteria bacterium]NNC96865.1 hypothetical protein [Gammaproteobacteria bacterium]NNM13010.1 hypothetical protein [Gammaproteobacteria bacterium]
MSMQYNTFVSEAFSNPRHLFDEQVELSRTEQSSAGAREQGVWFKLIFDQPNHRLYYKVYGNPYAIAAAEYLAREVSAKSIEIGQKLDLENLRELLDMPYPYLHILLSLEDAWNALQPQ